MTPKLISLSILMFTATILFAQGRFSVQLSAGAGQSAANVKLDYNNYHLANYKNTGSYYLHGGIGYEIKRWRLSTGVEFFRTGFHKGFAYGNDQFGFYENIMVHSENIAIPLLISYKVPILKNISIVPVAGAAMVFASGTYYYTNDLTTDIDPWDHLGITKEITAAAVAKVFAEIKLSKRTSVFAGPSVRYLKPNQSLQYYLYLFEAGLIRNF